MSPGSRAVTRMLTCCLGKGLEIVELSWRAGEPEARAALTLSGDPARLARAGLWLDRLVEVIEVRRDACCDHAEVADERGPRVVPHLRRHRLHDLGGAPPPSA